MAETTRRYTFMPASMLTETDGITTGDVRKPFVDHRESTEWKFNGKGGLTVLSIRGKVCCFCGEPSHVALTETVTCLVRFLRNRGHDVA